ncbi:MAG: M48 family metalloprotease [Acidobacteriota bacterium]
MWRAGHLAPWLAVAIACAPQGREPELSRYLNRLGGELAKHAGGRQVQYRFTVASEGKPGYAEEEPVAGADGAVLVPLKLVREARTETELAGLLAHAIAHVALGHASRMADRAAPSALALARSLEIEADLEAVRIMAEAGYDPASLPGLIARLPPYRSGGQPKGLSPYPHLMDRVWALERKIHSLPPRDYRLPNKQFERIKSLLR